MRLTACFGTCSQRLWHHGLCVVVVLVVIVVVVVVVVVVALLGLDVCGRRRSFVRSFVRCLSAQRHGRIGCPRRSRRTTRTVLVGFTCERQEAAQ